MAPKSKKAVSADSASSNGGDATCRVTDVLMGRGKRISEWPGNVHFRQVVNRYRDKYHQCSRKEKVNIANSVLEVSQGPQPTTTVNASFFVPNILDTYKDIKRVGGRFLQQTKGDKWDEVDYERSIEKACQALREKEKSKPPETSPFGVDPTSCMPPPPKAPPTVRPAVSHRKPAKTVLAMKKNQSGKRNLDKMLKSHGNRGDDDDDDGGVDRKNNNNGTSTEEESTSADESGNEEQSGDDSTSSSAAAIETLEIFQNPRQWGDQRMFPLLQTFQNKHGHTAVPPWDCLPPVVGTYDGDDDDEDKLLANWCTVQRQIYREVKVSNYRPGTVEEMKRIDRLDELGFVWDYEAWHWEQSYQLAKQEMEQSTATKMGLSDSALEWFAEQRLRGKRGMPQGAEERAKKLKAIDVFII